MTRNTPLRWKIDIVLFVAATTPGSSTQLASAGDYVVVDTGQIACYDSSVEITPPDPGEMFYGQDGQYAGNQPDYVLSGDGLTVTDNVTGLTWQRFPDTNGDGTLDSDDKLTYAEAQSYPATLNAQVFGGYDDWRLPTIKELYSLIDFRGIDPSGYTGGTAGLVPFIDTSYFDFVYGDESAGERIIDAQYWSSTEYVGTVFDGQRAVFGVNFADGRIKGYPRDIGPGGTPFSEFTRLVRGNPAYGINSFDDNGDGTITDQATGLMWMQRDNGEGITWEQALAFAESLQFAGYDDWRLPNAKELQSIVDYTRSPSTTGSAAIDPVFFAASIVNEAGVPDYPCYWAGTTHVNCSSMSGGSAAYVAFGRAMGYMNGAWIDVHGAGAQRSDPKEGDPNDWPYGHGPQGDAIRIYNYVRCVRGEAAGIDDGPAPDVPQEYGLLGSFPNPSESNAIISFFLPDAADITLEVRDMLGRQVATLARGSFSAGFHLTSWQTEGCPSGAYLCSLDAHRWHDWSVVTILR